MKKTSFIIPVSAIFAGGLALVGIAAGVWQKWDTVFSAPSSQESMIIQATEEVLPSAFQWHYVGYEGRFAKIPQEYCFLEQSERLITPCGQKQAFIEIDLDADRLPVEKIQSAVVSGNGNTIAYATYSEKKTSIGCSYPDLFVYYMDTKQTTKLNNDPSMWTCGAAGSYLASMSQGGRYLFVGVIGSSGRRGSWVYDTQLDKLDVELTDKSVPTVFSLGEDTVNEDRYMIYVDACMDFDDSCRRSPKLMLRDNSSGRVTELLSLETQLRRKGFDLRGIQGMEYSASNGDLMLWTGELGSRVNVSDFRGMVQRLAW